MKPISQLGYEESPRRTDRGRAQLEQGGLDLDASLKLWERGEELAKRCEEHLAGARQKVEKALASRDDDRSLTLEPVEPIGGRNWNTFQLFSLSAMGDSTLTTELGRVLVTGGSGFVGTNLVTERCSTRPPGPLLRPGPVAAAPARPARDVVRATSPTTADVAAAVDGIDTVIHTAAIIDLMGGGSVTGEYRERSFAVNVGGTENLVHAGAGGRGEAIRLHRIQQRGDGRPEHRRRRRNPALHQRDSTTCTPRPRWSPRNSCLVAERRRAAC